MGEERGHDAVIAITRQVEPLAGTQLGYTQYNDCS